MFNRIALRFAACEALCPHARAETGPWPTIAGNRVIDSRQDPIDLLSDDEQQPLIIVYTEEHNSTAFGRAARFGTSEQIVNLVLELMIATRGQAEVVRADGSKEIVGSVDVPVADWQHETLLDALEGLTLRALTTNNPASEAFRKVAVEIRQHDSVPLRSADQTVRLAHRTMTLKIQVRADEWPRDPSATAEALLPEPLASLLPFFPEGTSAGDELRRLAAYAPAPASFGIPEIRLFGNLNRGAAPTEQTAEFTGRYP